MADASMTQPQQHPQQQLHWQPLLPPGRLLAHPRMQTHSPQTAAALHPLLLLLLLLVVLPVLT
jgi:hypothetical protein